MQTVTPSSLAAELTAAAPRLEEHEQRLAVGLYRLLAQGSPVEAGSLAKNVGLPLEDAKRALAEWAGIFIDEQDRVIGLSASRSGRCRTG